LAGNPKHETLNPKQDDNLQGARLASHDSEKQTQSGNGPNQRKRLYIKGVWKYGGCGSPRKQSQLPAVGWKSEARSSKLVPLTPFRAGSERSRMDPTQQWRALEGRDYAKQSQFVPSSPRDAGPCLPRSWRTGFLGPDYAKQSQFQKPPSADSHDEFDHEMKNKANSQSLLYKTKPILGRS
jgi:hypothetical protein